MRLTIIQKTDVTGRDQGGGSGDEGELTGFADGLDMRLKRKKEVEDDSQVSA